MALYVTSLNASFIFHQGCLWKTSSISLHTEQSEEIILNHRLRQCRTSTVEEIFNK